MKLSIIIPVYNEISTLDEIISRVQSAPIDLEKEIILIDDCSTDGSREKLKEFEDEKNIKVLYHEKNQGKGAALRTGFDNMTGQIAIIQDADLEYDPDEYPVVLGPILDGKADVVYGSRFLSGPHRVLYFWHCMGNKALTLFSNMLNNLNLTDMETCYKAFKTEVLDGVKLKSNRFGFEPEFTAKIAKKKVKIYEVPISYSGRSYEEGKKITWKDGVSALYCIIRFRFFN